LRDSVRITGNPEVNQYARLVA